MSEKEVSAFMCTWKETDKRSKHVFTARCILVSFEE